MADEQTLVPAQAVPESMKAVTKFTAEHAHEVRLPSPEALNYMVSVAKLILDSTLITGDMGNNVEQIKANALAKMLVGLDFEMSPMESLQEIDIVKSRIFMRYPRLMAVLEKKGLQPQWIERSNERCAIQVTRPGRQPETFEYTIADAKMAGLVRQGSQYELRPRVMLSARVVSEAYRMTGGKSNVYVPEEKQEILENDIRENGTPAASEPENRFTVGRKPAPAPGSDAEFSQAGKAAAKPAEQSATETTQGQSETANPAAETSAPVTETSAPAAGAFRTKTCGCVAGECMVLADGKLAEGRFCREGRTLGEPAATAEPVADTTKTEPTVAAPAAEDPARALRKSVIDQLNVLTDYYKEQAPKTVMSKFNTFFRGVLGVTTLPKDAQVFMDLIPALKAAIVAETAAFWKDPAGAGRIEAEDRKIVDAKILEWKWNPAMKPFILRAKYFFGGTGTDICEYIEHSHKLTALPPAAAEAFLRMAAISREVYRLAPVAKFAQRSYDVLLSQMESKMELTVEQFTEKQLVALIEIAEKTMAEEKAKTAAVTAAASTAPAANPNVGQVEPEQPELWDTEA